jgi:hypothetical protein
MTKITIDRVAFLLMALFVLLVSTERFTGDLPALAAFLVVVGGVIILD